jgi:polysaccharide biosynthesis protein PslH
LFLAPVAPRRDGGHGGSRAIAELLLRLADRHPVALVCLRGPNQPPTEAALLERCDMVREVPRPASGGAFARLTRRVRVAGALARGTPAVVAGTAHPGFMTAVRDAARAWRPDIIQLEYHLMGAYLPALRHASAPRILRQLEPGAATARDRVAHRPGPARFTGALERRAWERFERAVMAQVQVVVALTRRDAEALRPLAGRTPVECIRLGVTPPVRPFDPTGAGGELLFVGNYTHTPNMDAVDRLIHGVLPRVRAACPDAVLRVVGASPASRWLARESEGVLVAGTVPDIGPFLDRAAVVLAPVTTGGGMRVKVMEALAGGKALVATPLALEGLEVEDGEQVCIGRTDEELARATIELLRSPDRRAALGGRARQWAIAAIGWEGPVTAFERLYQSLLASPPGS